MGEEGLTREQLKFLEECSFEFCDRFTDADVEYKKIFDAGIPPPPIMYPWHRRNRFNHRDRGDRPGGSRYNDQDSRNDRGDGRNNNYRSGSRKRPYNQEETHSYSRYRTY